MLRAEPPHPAGDQLDGSLRQRLERSYRTDLSAVRIRTDSSAPEVADAAAATVGEQIVVNPERYRPGTSSGDLLVAHEVAHVVQQRGGAEGASEAGLEGDADRAAASAVGASGEGGFFPRLRAALSLQSCKGCTAQEQTLVEQFKDETDPVRLADMLKAATDDQLRRLNEARDAGVIGDDALHNDAVAWEQAIRTKRFQALADLNRSSDPRFRVAYGDRIVALIMTGAASIRVAATDGAFIEFVRGSFEQLVGTASGFTLVVDLLATGQPVTLKRGGDHTTEPVDDAEAGRTIMDQGRLVQQRGRGTGSSVTLNPEAIANQATLGSERGRVTIIPMEGASTMGHELIHALHNARGDSLGPPVNPVLLGLGGGVGLVRDPITGEAKSPEELRAVTGQTSFNQINPGGRPDSPAAFRADRGITENDLRRDLGQPDRASHVGFGTMVTVPRRGAATVDELVARYRVNGRPVTAPTAVLIRAMLVELRVETSLADPARTTISVPTAEYVRMQVRFVERNPMLADQLEKLAVE